MHPSDHDDPSTQPDDPTRTGTKVLDDAPATFLFGDDEVRAQDEGGEGATAGERDPGEEFGDIAADGDLEELEDFEVATLENEGGTAAAAADEVEVDAAVEVAPAPEVEASMDDGMDAPADVPAVWAQPVAVREQSMDLPAEVETVAPAPAAPREHSALAALVWRCASIYTLLFCLPFPANLLPWTQAWAARWTAGEQALVAWLAERMLGIAPALPAATGGDTQFDWLRSMFAALAAIALGGTWHLLRRRRRPGARLRDVARTYVRYFVAGTLLGYGANKAIPLQFGQLDPELLSTPLGQLEPASLLWTFMASSPVYTSFVGCVEVVAGLLLLWRNTTLLGALLTLGVVANVTMLGFCFDVPNKLLSLHLLVFAALLLARDARRMLELFLHNRAVAPAALWPWWRTAWLRRPLKLVKIAFVGWLLFSNVRNDFVQWQARHAALPPLAGVYAVDALALSGAEVPPFSSPQRWVRLHVRRDGLVLVTATDGTQLRYRGEVDQDARVLHLRPEPGSAAPAAELRFATTVAGHVEFDGTIGGAPLRLSCRRLEVEGFALARRAFEWIERR